MAGIFISDRREDIGGHAGRLCDPPTARFASDRVLMDIQDTITATREGTDALGRAAVYYVFPGTRGLEAQDAGPSFRC